MFAGPHHGGARDAIAAYLVSTAAAVHGGRIKRRVAFIIAASALVGASIVLLRFGPGTGVARVLAATEGHKSRAADILRVSRPRLNRLMEKYGLE